MEDKVFPNPSWRKLSYNMTAATGLCKDKTVDWLMLVFGAALGSCVTTALVWFQRRDIQAANGNEFFSRVALSVVLTSLVLGVLWTLIDFSTSGAMRSGPPLFATGWLLGGLVGGWFVSRPRGA